MDGLQRRRPWVGFPIAVVYKYIDDSGGYLAALITYYAFVSLFPLLLVFATVLGFVLSGDVGLQHRIETSALSQFPVVGPELGRPRAIGGGVLGLVVGVLGALYGGLGVAQAAQYTMNTAWSVPRNSRPDPFKSRGRSLLLLLTVGVAVLVTTGLSALSVSGSSALGVVARIGVLVVSVLLNGVVFVFAFRFSTARSLTVRQLVPGALSAAVAWQLLQTFGVRYVGHVVKNASATNSVFAVVLGLLAFLYLTAVAIVISAEINVVRVRHLYPRALLTPFTDNVELTRGDERAYTEQAEAQRAKGFQSIEVSFDPDRPAEPSDPAAGGEGHIDRSRADRFE
ncbi:ribonuclease BN [Nocardioides mangrovicus]|uniref:Ribonuclease BN n=1 Tax=Nocardioides mangrovicus TaxID=2478913 RepID=A0A3L8P2Q6_9ACTN|nr:ribonuclease BN [Nocardioides mangrovicus]